MTMLSGAINDHARNAPREGFKSVTPAPNAIALGRWLDCDRTE